MDPRNCLVTGANRGIGLEFTRQLLANGEHVVATAREPGRANELNALAGEHPGRLQVLPLDVSDPRSLQRLVGELPLVLGPGGRLDLVINNAGVLHSGERFGSVQAAVLDDSLRVNAVAPFLLVQALAPLLGEAGPAGRGARIANISSQLGSIAGANRFGTPSYCISKAAQNMATVQLAAALRERGIVVVALHPGWVQTAMGGTEAPLPAEQAVRGLRAVIDGLGEADSGRFLDWQGQPLAW